MSSPAPPRRSYFTPPAALPTPTRRPRADATAGNGPGAVGDRGATRVVRAASGEPGDVRKTFSVAAQAGGRFSLPVKGRLYFEPGAELKVPYFAPGAHEGVGVSLRFQHPAAWACAYGCKGLQAVTASGEIIIRDTHTWNCDFWYTHEGKDATPFD